MFPQDEQRKHPGQAGRVGCEGSKWEAAARRVHGGEEGSASCVLPVGFQEWCGACETRPECEVQTAHCACLFATATGKKKSDINSEN